MLRERGLSEAMERGSVCPLGIATRCLMLRFTPDSRITGNPSVRKRLTKPRSIPLLLLFLLFRLFHPGFHLSFEGFVEFGIGFEDILRGIAALGELCAIVGEP